MFNVYTKMFNQNKFKSNVPCLPTSLNRIGFSHAFQPNLTFRELSDDVSSSEAKINYVMDSWRRDFPDYSSISYSELLGIVSRSAPINKWYSDVSSEYHKLSLVPQYALDGGITPTEWDGVITEAYDAYKLAQKDYYSKVTEAQKNFKKATSEASDSFGKKVIDLVKGKPGLGVRLLNNSSLPYSVIIESMKLDSKEKARAFLTEELQKMRAKLLNQISEGSLTEDDLILLMQGKVLLRYDSYGNLEIVKVIG
jgi:hypothetical protein